MSFPSHVLSIAWTNPAKIVVARIRHGEDSPRADHRHNPQLLEESTLRARDEKSLFSLQHNLPGAGWHYPVECKFYVRDSMYLGSLCRKVRGRTLRIRSDERLASLP